MYSEFLDTFDGNHDGKVSFIFKKERKIDLKYLTFSSLIWIVLQVSPNEFIEYYNNVSSSIDEDDYFELMIRNAWHISGGEGWCANSSCRRVLVVHTDGRTTVEEIKVGCLVISNIVVPI